MDVQLYWNEDHTEYAVLVSVDYGAGWSTWNKRELAYDSRVVEFYLAHRDDEEWMRTVDESGLMSHKESAAHKEAREFFESIGYENVLIWAASIALEFDGFLLVLFGA